MTDRPHVTQFTPQFGEVIHRGGQDLVAAGQENRLGARRHGSSGAVTRGIAPISAALQKNGTCPESPRYLDGRRVTKKVKSYGRPCLRFIGTHEHDGCAYAGGRWRITVRRSAADLPAARPARAESRADHCRPRDRRRADRGDGVRDEQAPQHSPPDRAPAGHARRADRRPVGR